MEWQGIDLSFYHQRDWVKETLFNIIKVIVSLIISCLLFLGLSIYGQNQQVQHNSNLMEYKKIQEKITILESKINNIKQKSRKEDNKVVSHNAINKFINYIQKFKVSGVIEVLSLYKESENLAKVSGRLNHQDEFKLIEQQLKESNLDYQIEQYQTNDKQQIEFMLLIKLGE